MFQTASARTASSNRLAYVLDWLSASSVGIKINVLLLILGLLPPLATLLYLQHIPMERFQSILALYIAGFVLVFYPLAKALQELLVLRQTRQINNYVDEVKSGRRAPHFTLPDEKGDEHDFLRLQRNIFWMVQGLKTRETRLNDTLKQLETAQRRVIESIEYASLIQRSFLPSAEKLRQILGDHFLVWLPRDGVGGDAYWVKRTDSQTFLAVFDCTGHGVPGAFLTLIVNSLFEQNFSDDCAGDPAKLLSKMNKGLKNALSQHGERKLSDDGLEGGLCCIDHASKSLTFAGARSQLLLAGEKGIQAVKGDSSGVGFIRVPTDQKYANHHISLQGIHTGYLFTDGITDQIGGHKKLPFGRRRLKDWLGAHASCSMEEQRQALIETYEEYKGRNAQRDDVTVLGFSIKELSR